MAGQRSCIPVCNHGLPALGGALFLPPPPHAEIPSSNIQALLARSPPRQPAPLQEAAPFFRGQLQALESSSLQNWPLWKVSPSVLAWLPGVMAYNCPLWGRQRPLAPSRFSPPRSQTAPSASQRSVCFWTPEPASSELCSASEPLVKSGAQDRRHSQLRGHQYGIV